MTKPKTRNPIARVVRDIRPQVFPDKRRKQVEAIELDDEPIADEWKD